MELPDIDIPDIGLGSDFTVEWHGLEDYSGDAIFAVLENANDDGAVPLRPIEAEIDADGIAMVVFTEGYGDGDWKLYYWVDGNGNGTCEQDDSADVKQRISVASDLETIGLSYSDGFASAATACERF